MLIVCPTCATAYRLTPDSLGEAGRAVRCVNCHTVWHELPHAPTATVEPEAIDPTRIRPPLNDVIDIGAVQAGSSGSLEFLAEDDDLRETRSDLLADATTPPPISTPTSRFESPQFPTPNFEWFGGRRRRLELSRYAMPATICALILVFVCLIAGRQQVVRFLPQTASLYAQLGMPVNLRGLAFANVKTTRDMQDGIPTIIVEGEIVATTGRHAEVPRLRLAVTDSNGKEIYAWTARPSRSLLPPGETLPFRAQLASPPAEASGISVRFFNRRDAQAGFI